MSLCSRRARVKPDAGGLRAGFGLSGSATLGYTGRVAIPPILCVAGESGSGKTTLLERLIAALSAEGVKVGAIKHAGGRLDLRAAGKDSTRLAAAGARPAVAAGAGDLTVQHAPAEPSLIDLAASYCAGCDLVLAEGYKHSPHDKLVVGPAGVAAGDVILDRDDVPTLAAWVRAWLERRRRLGRGLIAAILTGGASRRMGADKAALRIAGRGVLAHLAELLAGRVEDVWIVGRAADDADRPRCVRWHLDLRPGCGPLGGIATALRIASVEAPRAVLAVACDMPALGGEAVDLLLAGRRPDRPASALRHPATGRVEPLAAVYEPAALAEIERAIEAGELSARRLLESVAAHAIDVPARIADQLANVNTPEELRALGDRRRENGSH